MDRAQKREQVAELKQVFSDTEVVVVTRNLGLSVAQSTKLRNEMREAGARYKVTKNTLARRAIASTPYQASERWLDGQTALVFGYEDPIAVTKVVAKWAEVEAEKFAIKGGFFEGELLESKAVVALSKTPSKEALRAQLLGVLQAPAQKLVRLLAEPGAQFARLMSSRKDALGPATDE